MQSGIKLFVLISAISAVNHSNGMAPRLQAELVQLKKLIDTVPAMIKELRVKQLNIETKQLKVRKELQAAQSLLDAIEVRNIFDDSSSEWLNVKNAVRELKAEDDALSIKRLTAATKIEKLAFSYPRLEPAIKQLEAEIVRYDGR